MKKAEAPSPAGLVAYEFGPFRVDPVRHLLSRDGVPVAISSKPLQTLLVLLRRRGEDVSRQRLLEEVWSGAVVEGNNLSQCISVLRKALREDPKEHRYIATIPGYGYRFVAPVEEVSGGRAPAREGAGRREGAISRPARRKVRPAVLALGLVAAFAILAVAAFRERLGVPASPPAPRPAVLASEAISAYEEGRFFLAHRKKESLERAVTLFQRSVEIEPDFGLAYSGLADSQTLLWEYTYDWRYAAEARAAAEGALRLAGDRAEVLTTQGNVLQVFSWSFEEAEREFRRAIEADPSYPTAHHWYGWCLMALGRVPEAQEQMRRAEALDPLSPIIASAVGTSFYFGGQHGEAMDQYRRALTLDADFSRARLLLGQVLSTAGRHDEAIRELEAARSASGGSSESLAALGFALAAAGDEAGWRETLRLLEERDRSGQAAAAHFAILYAATAETSRALDWLEKACHRKTISPALVRLDPRFAALRRAPRFERACPL